MYKYVNRQLTLIVMVAAMSIASFSIPYCKSILTLFLCGLINGIGCGAWDNAVYVWLIEMWAHNSGPILQMSQFMFGLGTIVGPLLGLPYITGEENYESKAAESLIVNHTYSLIAHNQTTFAVITPEERRQKLKTPFALNGSIQAISKCTKIK